MLMAECEQIPAGRLACLIYTSGTGGSPKGVMLPHRAMLANRAGLATALERLPLDGTPYLSFLPLSHSYEHTVGCFLLPSLGMEVVYSRGAERLAAEMAEVRPTILTAVPRLFEVLRARMLAQIEKEGGLKRRLFERALALGLRRLDGPPLGLRGARAGRRARPAGARQGPGALRRPAGGHGVGRGAARPRPVRLLPGARPAGAPGLRPERGGARDQRQPALEQRPPHGGPRRCPASRRASPRTARSWCAATWSWTATGTTRTATARALPPSGGAAPGRAPRPWLHTGDVGRLEEGRLVVTDRKRDFIKTLGGDMVSPAKIEGLLMAEPEIAQAVAAGEGQPGDRRHPRPRRGHGGAASPTRSGA